MTKFKIKYIEKKIDALNGLILEYGQLIQKKTNDFNLVSNPTYSFTEKFKNEIEQIKKDISKSKKTIFFLKKKLNSLL